MREFTIIDLFAGTGGFSLAFQLESKQFNKNISNKSNKSQIIYKCIFANDKENESERIFKLNNPDVDFNLNDLNNIEIDEIPNHDILCAGFPCQPFSIAGKQNGFGDERSNVIWKLLEIIRIKKPNIIILENVKNFISHDEGKTYSTIKEKLKQYNYYIKSYILDTCKVTNIPQHRERLYIVCFKDKSLYDKFEIEYDENDILPISDFLDMDVDINMNMINNIHTSKYYYNDKFKVYNTIKENVIKHIKTNTIYQYRRFYVRESKNGYCPTLTCNMGKGGHNVPIILDDFGIRKLTPRECFNLQGFPKDFKLPKITDSKLYSLSGNAITVSVVRLIAKKLSEIL